MKRFSFVHCFILCHGKLLKRLLNRSTSQVFIKRENERVKCTDRKVALRTYLEGEKKNENEEIKWIYTFFYRTIYIDLKNRKLNKQKGMELVYVFMLQIVSLFHPSHKHSFTPELCWRSYFPPTKHILWKTILQSSNNHSLMWEILFSGQQFNIPKCTSPIWIFFFTIWTTLYTKDLKIF